MQRNKFISALFMLCAVCSFTRAEVKAIVIPNHSTLNTKHLTLNVKVFKDSTTTKDTSRHKKHRLVAALLAFPLGVFGTHRMYLGTSAKVPILYIITAGGFFGILPFIDFVLILLNKDINNTYAHNRHTFMWHKEVQINK